MLKKRTLTYTPSSKIVLLGLFMHLSVTSFAQGFNNQVFNDSIKSVTLLKELNNNDIGDHQSLPYIHLNTQEQLDLRFDDLRNSNSNYSYTLVHCDPQWKPSDLNTNEYIDGYEEDNISDYTFSQNTTQNYIHYHVRFPSEQMKLTKAGNYVILVYESGSKNKVILSQKFYVLKNNMIITPLPTFTLNQATQSSHHQISFKANQSAINSNDPFNEYRFVVKQNGNYQTEKVLQPTHIAGHWISFFGNEVSFESGNEFRQFDTRNINLNTNGVGVFKSVYKAPHYHSVLRPCNQRSQQNYSEYPDHNGELYHQSQNTKSSYFETDYTWVYFFFNKSELDTTDQYYVWGGLSSWELKEGLRMKYNPKTKQYVAKAYLKQGVYDYSILHKKIKSKTGLSSRKTEGNFHETDNYYSILIYHKAFTDNAYQLVGLKNFIYR